MVLVLKHSTKDFYENAESALMMLVDANDKLETLNSLYKDSKLKIKNGNKR